jgi:hypothetical protein
MIMIGDVKDKMFSVPFSRSTANYRRIVVGFSPVEETLLEHWPSLKPDKGGV